MINTYIEEPFSQKLEVSVLEIAAQAALNFMNSSKDTELTIVVDSNEKVQTLNRDFLGINKPTDVLSFPTREYDPDSQLNYIGDIIISYPTAEAQALRAGHPVANEISLLVVHGVLHLLGYDHRKPDDKARMWEFQSEILKSFGCVINALPED